MTCQDGQSLLAPLHPLLEAARYSLKWPARLSSCSCGPRANEKSFQWLQNTYNGACCCTPCILRPARRRARRSVSQAAIGRPAKVPCFMRLHTCLPGLPSCRRAPSRAFEAACLASARSAAASSSCQDARSLSFTCACSNAVGRGRSRSRLEPSVTDPPRSGVRQSGLHHGWVGQRQACQAHDPTNL